MPWGSGPRFMVSEEATDVVLGNAGKVTGAFRIEEKNAIFGVLIKLTRQFNAQD
jgi:hypothetical protein